MKFNFFLLAIILAFKPINSQCVGNVNIPDANFKAALLEQSLINTDGNLEISCAEAAVFTGTIDVSSKSITDLTGIEAFTNLKRLNCSGNSLTSLDVSKNINLKGLACDTNFLTSLDVSKNITLDFLDCPNNLLTSLDTSKNINLFTLLCQNNLLKSIDLSKNIDLITLDCSGNSLTSLNVSKNIELDDLTCNNNLLTSLDVFNNTVLRGLICSNNLLTSLDLSNNPITLLWAGNNSLTSLNIANGNNNDVMSFSVTDNPGLFCIQVDAGFTPNEAITGPRRWSKNRFASFSSNCTSVLRWLGTTNNDWHTATNWEKGVVPVATDRVEIPSGLTKYPTVSSEVTVSSITLQNNATLIGNERVNGIVIYNKTLTANWHLITPPVSNQTYDNLIQYNSFEGSTITPTNIAIGIYNNNGSNEWNYEAYNAPRDGSSVGRTGLGLAVKLGSLVDINFIGNINVTNVHKPISVGDRTNFNLLGNPFTSYMNSENFVNTNSSLLNEKTIWLWNGTEYETYTLANPIKIEPARGFFVTAISDGNVVFETNNQSHKITNSSDRKKSHANIELLVNDKSTKIYFIENTTAGFDNGYDGSMFDGRNNDLEVYTKLVEDENNISNKKLAIQALPISNLETMVIPVGIVAKAGEELTFSAKTLNLKEEFSVYLEDNVNNTFTNISEKEYKIIQEERLNTAERFYIHLSTKTLNIENNNDISKKIDIYKSDKNKITIVGLENNNATVTVYSLLGEEVLKANIANSTTLDLPVLSTGVYVVKLNSKVGKKTKKIILD